MVGRAETCSCKIEFLQIYSKSPKLWLVFSECKNNNGLLYSAYVGCRLAMLFVALFSDLCCSVVFHIAISCVEKRNMMVLLLIFSIIH